MSNPLNRRAFLRAGALAAAAAGGLPRGTAASTGRAGLSPGGQKAPDPATAARAFASPAQELFRISLAQWSLHRTIRSGEVNHLDFARVARHDFGIEAIEYVNTFFMDRAKDPAYLADMNRRAADNGVYQHLIMCDAEGRLGDPAEAARRTAVANHHKWIDAAKTLGCVTIRVNAASEGTWEEQARLAADGLRQLCEYGELIGINVIVENHGGLSSNGKWLAEVMRRVDHPRCGTLPDFGNFNIADGQVYDRYMGVAELMPFAKAVSAKSHDFDEAGNETDKDYRRLMRIVLDAGFHSWVGIEYEGNRLGEREGIQRTKTLLERVRSELSGPETDTDHAG
ncbi:MAG: sugar phosphate isomerase/epimerase family protein [Longimicrobiales bacterium]